MNLTVHDMLGREVANLVGSYKQPGEYHVDFNAARLSSGIYFYSITTNSGRITKKLTVLR